MFKRPNKNDWKLLGAVLFVTLTFWLVCIAAFYGLILLAVTYV